MNRSWVVAAAFLIATIDFFLQMRLSSSFFGISNQGFGFGLGQGTGSLFFWLLTFFLFYLITARKLTETGWWLVLAGGVSNGLSRLILGSVRDYLYWSYGFSLWFNLADILIVFGIIFLWRNYSYR